MESVQKGEKKGEKRKYKKVKITNTVRIQIFVNMMKEIEIFFTH